MTTDRNLRHQQVLARRRLGVVVLPTTDWSAIRRNAALVSEALEILRPGDVRELSFVP